MKYFLLLIDKAYQCDSLLPDAQNSPVSLQSMHRLTGLTRKSFIEYIVCPRCESIYEFEDCIQYKSGGKMESKTCCHIPEPHHPQRARRSACGAVLLKTPKTKKKSKLRQVKVFPYRPLKKSMHELLNRSGFLQKCEHWREVCMPDCYLGDVYDGEVWKTFNSSEYKHFLKTPYS